MQFGMLFFVSLSTTSYPGFSLCGRGLKRTLTKAAEHYVICCIFPGGVALSRRACSQAAVLFIH